MPVMNLLDEKHITNAFIYIDGTRINYVSLFLEQSFGEHHTFSIKLDYDVVKKDFLTTPLEQIYLIGKQVNIELQQGDNNANAYEFRGIICDVYNEGQEGKHGYVFIDGKSPTVLMERGKRMDIFSDMELQQIFDEVTDDIKSKTFSKFNNPEFKERIPFLMQYDESDWDFLRRLSAISGESLYYTGMDLVFGRHKEWPVTKVMYDYELTNIHFGAYMLSNSFTQFQYVAESNEFIKVNAPDFIEGGNEYITAAQNGSNELITNRPARRPSALPIDNKESLKELVARSKITNASQTIYLEGTSKTCAPRIGRLLKVVMPDGMSEGTELGTYRVIKVQHAIDQNNHYSAKFMAIPASLKYYPLPTINRPVANSLLGTVVSNADPQNQGRVLVEFAFAQDRKSSTWIRVMSPNAGGEYGLEGSKKGDITHNRGWVFIPEVGDQVMVDFEFGDPNRPYVTGCMFHGGNAKGGGTDNHLKSIATRSGHILEFDDAENSLAITIKDKSGNVMKFDTKRKNIEITTPETMTLNAKNLVVNTEADVTYNVGKNMSMNVTETLSQRSKTEMSQTENKTGYIEKDCNIAIKGNVKTTADKAEHLTSGDYYISSQQTIIISGTEDVRLT